MGMRHVRAMIPVLALAAWASAFIFLGWEFAAWAIAVSLIVIGLLCWGPWRPRLPQWDGGCPTTRARVCPRCLSPRRGAMRTPCSLPAYDPHPWHDPRFTDAD